MAKSVFITGAAAGIGRATARKFADRGWFVGAYDVDEVGLATLADELGSRVRTGHLDVTDAEEMSARITEFVEAADGRLDVLVNNAGVMAAGLFQDVALEAQHRMIDINCKGVINGLYAAYPHLLSTPGAVAVNLASASAIYGQAELAVYSATKFFVRAMTEALDLEWARDDIRVIAMWPLFVQTAMVDGVRTGTTDSLGVKLTADDVADAILDAVTPSWLRRRLHQVHFAVGTQTKVLAAASRFSPAWLSRLANKGLSRA